jgi:hypothetical protein
LATLEGAPVGLFGGKKDEAASNDRARLVDPAMLRRKGVRGRARILNIESKPSTGGSVADPAYDCFITIEASADGIAPYSVTVRQRLLRSALAILAGDGVVAPAWLDPKDPSRVAIDIAAGEIERA